MARRYHVSSASNRASIEEHGLDWTRMGEVPGIAGARTPEVEGVFLCRDLGEVELFLRFEATDKPVDVWAVDGIDAAELITPPNGFDYLPRPIPREALTRIDPPGLMPIVQHRGPSGAYQSTLTLTLDDGRVVRDEDARQFMRRGRAGSD